MQSESSSIPDSICVLKNPINPRVLSPRPIDDAHMRDNTMQKKCDTISWAVKNFNKTASCNKIRL
jgi:hypothetical protein